MHPINNDVAVFWDIENCRPPKASSGYDLVNNIRDIAHKYGSVKLLKAYVEPDQYTKASLRSELQLSGVTLADCPHNGNKEVADKMIIVDAMLWALDYPSSATIVIITGDRDFGYAISMLRLRRYHVVVISQTQLPSPPPACLTNQASNFFSWEKDVVKPSSVPPCHVRAQSVPSVPVSRSEASSSQARPRAVSIAGPAAVKPAGKQQSALSSSSGLSTSAPAIQSSFATRKNPVSRQLDTHVTPSAPMPASSQPALINSASPQPDVIHPSSPSSSTSSVTAVDQTPPVPLTLLPLNNVRRRPPIRMDSIANRSRPPSVLFSPSVSGTRSNHISVVHANGEFCGGQDATTSSTASMNTGQGDVVTVQSCASSSPLDTTNSVSSPVLEGAVVTLSPSQAEEIPLPPCDACPDQVKVTVQMGPGAGVDEQTQHAAEQSTAVEAPSESSQAADTSTGAVIIATPPPQTTLGSPVLVESPSEPSSPALAPNACLAVSSPTPSLSSSKPYLVFIPPIVVPAHFLNLVRLLQQYRKGGLHEPLMSKVAAELPNRTADEKAIGASRFGQFCDLAQEAGIIEVGTGAPGSEWVRLRPSFYHYASSSPVDPPVAAVVRPPASAKFAKFSPLVDLLNEYHASGKPRPTRSEVAIKLNKQHPRLFKEYGITKFKHYTRDAEKAGIIILGNVTKGDAWMSLNPSWSSDC